LFLAFIKALMAKEQKLPEAIFQNNLKELFNKKDVLIRSAETYGTPQYFYDAPSLIGHVGRFNQAFSNRLPHFRAFYALKSNSFMGIIKDVVAAGMGLDVSSGREVSMALETGCREILFSGPGKTDEELMLALKNRHRLTLLVDSFGELGRLSKLIRRGHQYKDPMKIGVRVQGLGEDRWNKFGVPLDDLGDILLLPNQGAYTYSLRQGFIKTPGKVVKFNGASLEEVEKEAK
jgi:diaminopimelate decarboxylase